MQGCEALTSIDALAGMTALQELDLSECSALTNINALSGITTLQELDIRGAYRIPTLHLMRKCKSMREIFADIDSIEMAQMLASAF